MPSTVQTMLKRAIDVAASGVGLLLTAPFVIIAGAAILSTMGSPILFRQSRPGRGGRLFTCYKFRTMMDERDAAGHPRPDFERVTGLGRVLRRMSIDELPQLWNVFKGDMSLVGPRPLLSTYLEHYNAVQQRRHEVRPGITGWAQVHRRTAVSWDERLSLDVWYVDHWSLWLDLKILARTIRDMLTFDGDPSMDTLSRTVAAEREFRGTSEAPNPTRSEFNP
jgi:lipopolysaccharide/colanic/teichoic acid biosynthesis glycosyltransferase